MTRCVNRRLERRRGGSGRGHLVVGLASVKVLGEVVVDRGSKLLLRVRILRLMVDVMRVRQLLVLVLVLLVVPDLRLQLRTRSPRLTR